MSKQFIIPDPAPIGLDRDALDAAETERLRVEQARSDEFLEELLGRKAGDPPVVRVV